MYNKVPMHRDGRQELSRQFFCCRRVQEQCDLSVGGEKEHKGNTWEEAQMHKDITILPVFPLSAFFLPRNLSFPSQESLLRPKWASAFRRWHFKQHLKPLSERSTSPCPCRHRTELPALARNAHLDGVVKHKHSSSPLPS